MDWAEPTRSGMSIPIGLPRPGGGPVFLDPHGRRLRRLRVSGRAVAAAAVVYLMLLALGLAGPAASPFSLIPRLDGGDIDVDRVKAGAGPADAADAVRVAGTEFSAVPGRVPGAPVDGVATPDPQPAAGAPAPGPATPQAAPADGSQPAAAPTGAPVPRNGAAPPANSPPPKSSPPPRSSPPPQSGPPPAQGNGPPAGAPPGQSKAHGPPPGHGGGNGPPANHGQSVAAQHSHSPNH